MLGLFVLLIFSQCHRVDIQLFAVGDSPDSSVFSMTVYNNELYVGGCLDSVGGIKSTYISKWNGQKWTSLDKGPNTGYRGVEALAVYNVELYAAGDFDYIDTFAVDHIAKWNGKEWSSFGVGKIDGVYPYIMALCVYRGELYAAGRFDSLGGIEAENIAKWNGKKWAPVGNGVNYTVISLTVYKGELYTGGICNKEDGASVKWDGNTWSFLTNDSTDFTEVQSYAIFRKDLLIGGSFGSYTGGSGGRTSKNPFNHIVKWDGKSYSKFEREIHDNEASIIAMKVYKNELFVGGRFNFPEGARAKNIIKWNGENWQTIASGTNGYVSCFTEYNDCLYAGGSFQRLNGKPISFLTKLITQEEK